MAEVVLFHHVQGLTDGVRAFAEELRAGGHTVHTPDLFEGKLPGSIDEGIALVDSIGDGVLTERGSRALADLNEGLVYAGFSYGGGMAQRFAQTRPGTRGALLYETCLPLTGEWGVGPWPEGVPVQIHGMDKDPYFALEGDLDAARELVEAVGTGPRPPSCSSTRATGTCSPTARCRRTTRPRRRRCCGARESSSTASADSTAHPPAQAARTAR